MVVLNFLVVVVIMYICFIIDSVNNGNVNQMQMIPENDGANGNF